MNKGIVESKKCCIFESSITLKLNIMKTQINSLVTGNFKTNTAGTSKIIRNEIASKVVSENKKSLEIELKSVKLSLKANWSLSGKSVTYFGTMPVSLYTEMFGEFCLPKEKPEAFIQINGDMTLFAYTNSKKSVWQVIEEKEITIL